MLRIVLSDQIKDLVFVDLKSNTFRNMTFHGFDCRAIVYTVEFKIHLPLLSEQFWFKAILKLKVVGGVGE